MNNEIEYLIIQALLISTKIDELKDLSYSYSFNIFSNCREISFMYIKSLRFEYGLMKAEKHIS